MLFCSKKAIEKDGTGLWIQTREARNSSIINNYHIIYPTMFLIDKGGKIVAIPNDEDEIIKNLKIKMRRIYILLIFILCKFHQYIYIHQYPYKMTYKTVQNS
jgi:hypothetical protein